MVFQEVGRANIQRREAITIPRKSPRTTFPAVVIPAVPKNPAGAVVAAIVVVPPPIPPPPMSTTARTMTMITPKNINIFMWSVFLTVIVVGPLGVPIVRGAEVALAILPLEDIFRFAFGLAFLPDMVFLLVLPRFFAIVLSHSCGVDLMLLLNCPRKKICFCVCSLKITRTLRDY